MVKMNQTTQMVKILKGELEYYKLTTRFVLTFCIFEKKVFDVV